MTKLTDQHYLKTQQYRSASNLEARIALHRSFGTNPYDWQLWVFDQLELEPGMQILEMGCGPASLWRGNLTGPLARRLPENTRIILGDLSTGMVREARDHLQGHPVFAYHVSDVQRLPLPSALFDRLIANHMLYHVPDIQAALHEFKRCLKPGQPLFAATNGRAHMAELDQLLKDFEPGYTLALRAVERFALENAREQLERVFASVEVLPFDCNLKVTDPAALIAYVASMWGWLEDPSSEKFETFERFVRQRFQPKGYLWITKSAGLVIARD
jgi:ubiquinone/menaquinone biosynthesis C-methylase UbiE